MFEPLREVADGLGAATVGIDQLLNSNDTTLQLCAIQHRREDFLQGTRDMEDDNSFTGAKRLIHQLLGVLGVTEGRIEYDLRLFGAAGYRERRALARGISAGREDHTIPTFRRRFRERPKEQFIANPGGGGVHGYPVLRPVLVVFVEQRGRVIRVQHVAEPASILRKVILRILPQLTKRLLANAQLVRVHATESLARLFLSWPPPPL